MLRRLRTGRRMTVVSGRYVGRAALLAALSYKNGDFFWFRLRLLVRPCTAKAAVKLPTLLDLRGNIPAFIHISDGTMHEVNVLDQLVPEAGASYVMDRGYLDFERLFRLHAVASL